MAKALDFCIERLKTLEPSSGKDSHDGEMNLLSQTKIHAEIDVSKPSGNPTAQESVAGLTNNESPVKSENHLPSMNSKRSSRPRVLLVEDNEINLKVRNATLTSLPPSRFILSPYFLYYEITTSSSLHLITSPLSLAVTA